MLLKQLIQSENSKKCGLLLTHKTISDSKELNDHYQRILSEDWNRKSDGIINVQTNNRGSDWKIIAESNNDEIDFIIEFQQLQRRRQFV